MAATKQKREIQLTKTVETDDYTIPVDTNDEPFTTLHELRDLVAATSHLPPGTIVEVGYEVSVLSDRVIEDLAKEQKLHPTDFDYMLEGDDAFIELLKGLGFSFQDIRNMMIDQTVQTENNYSLNF